jgi:hypothetical protein
VIDVYGERFGVEPICRVLEASPSTYYAHLAHGASVPSRGALVAAHGRGSREWQPIESLEGRLAPVKAHMVSQSVAVSGF